MITVTQSRSSAAGFTLVELAIVLMIIGLLIAGILRGQELMDIARMNSTIKQVTSYTGAMATFRDTYGGLPGDMRNAMQRVKGCTAANTCVNGDGNGVVGARNVLWIGGQQGITTENTQFWKHLMLSNIMTGVDPSANIAEWAESHPTTAVGGGFTVVTSMRDPNDPVGSAFNGALVLRMHGDLNGAITDQSPVVNPHQAAYIDRKLDDGFPNRGGAQSFAAGIIGGSQADCEQSYRESRLDTICIMAFVMNL